MTHIHTHRRTRVHTHAFQRMHLSPASHTRRNVDLHPAKLYIYPVPSNFHHGSIPLPSPPPAPRSAARQWPSASAAARPAPRPSRPAPPWSMAAGAVTNPPRLDSRYQEVLCNMKNRDLTDSHRDYAPLRIAPDAHVIDTTRMSPDDVLAEIMSLLSTEINCKTDDSVGAIHV